MVIAIWLLALILLLFWSAFVWMSYALLGMVAGAPWDQLLSQLKGLSLPEPLGQWWVMMVDLLAPTVQLTLPILQGLLSFAGSALPVMVGVIWVLGSLAVLLVTIAATIALVWWRKSRASLRGKRPPL